MKCRMIRVAGMSVMLMVPFAFGIASADADTNSEPCDIQTQYVVEAEGNISETPDEAIEGIELMLPNEGVSAEAGQDLGSAVELSGALTLTNENGVLRITDASGTYYQGIHEVNGRFYYADEDAKVVCDQFFIYKGKAYISGNDGSIQTGVVYSPERKFYYYCDPANGGAIKVTEGIVDWNGKKYHVNRGGNISVNRFFVYGKAYIAGRDGSFQTGVVYSPERRTYYYCDPANGGAIKVTEGIVDWNGKKYHVNRGGNISVNRFFVYGKAYIAGKDGSFQTGVVYSPERRTYYYCDPENGGAIKVTAGLVDWNGNRYHVNKGGNITVNKFFVSGKAYIAGSNGAVRKGIVFSPERNTYYYCDPADNGAIRVKAGSVVWNGVTYHIAAGGRIDNIMVLKADKLLNSIGRSLYSAYKYLADQPYYRMYVSTTKGKEWFAEFGMSRGEGNCYVKTAMLYYMAKALGYENIRAVDGFCLGYGGERLPHGWLEYYENGKTYIIDPTFETEVGRNGYMIEYGQKGTWRYLPNESRTWVE